ncbi:MULTISPECIES: type IIL restriction-modification enzyme MmeI [unclassified Microcoleus]|uniref:type IIL restriction-modification enzyme MmeI n=1 Tax=unclassified Microcoleus TaxID=2642155 RepID=UPI002FD3D79C
MNQGFKCLKANGSHPETMPPNLRADHATPQKSLLDRIYLDRRFKNDTERLEKLFELYTKMTSQQASSKKSAKPKGGK